MKIHETVRADGTLVPVLLRHADGALFITTDDGELALVDGALEAVMKRFGGPLETSEPLALIAELELGDGAVLRHVRHRARYDVIARDFLVYAKPGEDALCALAITVCAALTHLARAPRGSS
jgi:hypothetical protein